MKDLELTQSVHSPLLSVGSLGIAMDDHSHLAIGMFLGDGGYGWPGDAEAVGDTVAGKFLGSLRRDLVPLFHANCRPTSPHPIIGMGSPLN